MASDMIKRIWNDPVGSKVIAGLIGFALASAGSYLAGWWPMMADLSLGAVAFTVAKSALPNWLIGLLAGAAAFLAYALFRTLWDHRKAPTASDYVSDEFFGIRWRWRLGNDIWSLTPFCTRCDNQIIPRHASAYHMVDKFEYKCDDCGALLRTIEEQPHEFEGRVIRQIQRKLRSGDWVAAVEQARANESAGQ